MGILTVDGTIIQRDFNFPLLNENFEKSYFPLWNDITSQTNIERFPRLIMMSPFLTLSMLGIPVSIITKVMIIGAFTVITSTSYLFIKSISSLIFTNSGASSTTIADPEVAHDRNNNTPHHRDYFIKFISLLTAFIFAYNPVNMQFIGGISILVSVGMLPLLLYIVLKAGTKKYFPLLIVPPLLFSLGHPFAFVTNIIFTVVFTFIIHHRVLKLRHIFLKLALSSFVLVFFLAWLILPYLSIPINSVDLGRDQELARNTYDLVSDNNFYKIFLLERDKFIYTSTEPSSSFSNYIFSNPFHYFSLTLLISIACIALLFSFKKLGNPVAKRIIIFTSGGFVISLLLALGSSGPLDQPYWTLISQSPIGWIFRSPLKFQLYQGFFVSVLFAISVLLIVRRQYDTTANNSASRHDLTITILKKRIKKWRAVNYKRIVIAYALVMIFIGSSGYGIYSANTASFNPIQLPEEYFEINKILEAKLDGSKVIYYPRYNEISTAWSQDHIIPPYDMKSSVAPTYELSTSYAYVKETLYDYPYTKDLLNSTDFLDFLSTLGIKYIVFHNDRGYAIDQKNLSYLVNSSDLTTLYDKNSWYLFEINRQPEHEIWAIQDIAQTDNLPQDSFAIGSRSLAVIDAALSLNSSSSSNNNPSFEKLVTLKITNNNLNIKLKNEIPNASFSVWAENKSLSKSSLQPDSWNLRNQVFNLEKVFDSGKNEYVLKISTEKSGNNLWSALISSEIAVKSGTKYLFTFETKTINSHGTHAKIEGYDISTGAWKNLGFISDQPSNTSTQSSISLKSNSDWTLYRKILTISDQDGRITKVRYVINAGSVQDKLLGSGVTLVRQAGMYNLDDNNNNAGGVIGDNRAENSAIAVKSTKISPTKYQVHITNTSKGGSFLLAFSQAYEKGWVASYENTKEQIKSIPVYGMINGFYIDKTGDFTLNIEYRPQNLFVIGFVISLISVIVIVVGYLIIIQREKLRRNSCLASSKVTILVNQNNPDVMQKGELISNQSLSIFSQQKKRQELDDQTAATASTATTIMPFVNSDSDDRETILHSPNTVINGNDGINYNKIGDNKDGNNKNDEVHRHNNNNWKANLKVPTVMHMIKSAPSSLPIICAVGLTICIPFMVMTLQENLCNLIAEYAVDSLAIGIVANTLTPLVRH